MGKSSSQKTKQTIDPRLTNAALQVFGQGQTAANQLGVREIAGFTPDQLAAMQMTREGVGTGSGAVNQAVGTAGQVAGYNPQQVQGQSFLNADIGAYMNPYLQNVAGNVLSDLDRQRLMQQNQNAASAFQAKAFGGSRQGVLEAETNRAAQENAARALTDLYSGGFNAAAGLASSDMARAQEAALANQQAGLAGAGLNLQAAGQLGQLGQTQQQMAQSDIAALGNVGSMQQQLEQATTDAERNLILEKFQLQNAALGSLAPLAGNVTSKTTSTPSGMQTLGNIAQIAGAAMTMFPSDPSLKENIKPMKGALKKLSFLNGSTYNYMDDEDETPTGGIMADDVEEVMPGAVKTMDNGKMAVDYSKVTGLLVEAVKELDAKISSKKKGKKA
jgi:hypothetical protein